MIDHRFSLAFTKTSNDIQKRYPDALGGDLESYFLSEEISDELFRLLFRSSKGLSKINLMTNLKGRETGYYFEKPSINLLAKFINATNDLYKKCLSVLLLWKLNNSNYKRYDLISLQQEDWFYILQINEIEEVYKLLSEKYNLKVFLS